MKTLMLHGWSWKNYPKHNQGNPWSNRIDFLHSMEGEFEITAPTLPGFCNSNIPKNAWTLDEYAEWLYEIMQKADFDTILGYSFGAAVIVRCLTTYGNRMKKIPQIILISPAIVRKYQHKFQITSFLSKIFSIFPRLIEKIRNLYLTCIIKNPFYTEGDTFQQETYRNIVNIDLSEELEKLISKGVPIKLIFGSEDTSTPPHDLLSKVPSARSITSIIQGGGHDIANSHSVDLLGLVNRYIFSTTQ